MYSFLTSCVSVPNGDDINEMANIATDIDANDFLVLAEEHGFKDSMLEDLGYVKWASDNKETPEELFINDFGINLCESRFQGIPTLYVRHSGIENIYIPNTEFNKALNDEEESIERTDVIDDISDKYEDLFYNGMNNKNLTNELNEFVEKNQDILEKFNIPLTSLSAAFGKYDPEFLSVLRNKEQEYLAPLITLPEVNNNVVDYLENKISSSEPETIKKNQPKL